MTTTEAGTAADQAAIAALTQKVIAAWAYGDADGFANVFTEDGTMILPGIFKKGREEIRAFLVESFAGNYKGTQVTGRPIEIRFFTPDSGVLITQGGVLAAGETEVTDSQSIRASWTVVKRDGSWHLASYQNTPAKQQLPKPGTV
ncbi:SgcJ/EcaC family oxidoreductase [Amycolatopsis sp. NPDC051106]|uniref:SgcJ/EcaC family oxidoreductase n=1 Tax=unclassified Amycolatopsis TaxID=2618356 RepID=UPI0034259BF5